MASTNPSIWDGLSRIESYDDAYIDRLMDAMLEHDKKLKENQQKFDVSLTPSPSPPPESNPVVYPNMDTLTPDTFERHHVSVHPLEMEEKDIPPVPWQMVEYREMSPASDVYH